MNSEGRSWFERAWSETEMADLIYPDIDNPMGRWVNQPLCQFLAECTQAQAKVADLQARITQLEIECAQTRDYLMQVCEHDSNKDWCRRCGKVKRPLGHEAN